MNLFIDQYIFSIVSIIAGGQGLIILFINLFEQESCFVSFLQLIIEGLVK